MSGEERERESERMKKEMVIFYWNTKHEVSFNHLAPGGSNAWNLTERDLNPCGFALSHSHTFFYPHIQIRAQIQWHAKQTSIQSIMM